MKHLSTLPATLLLPLLLPRPALAQSWDEALYKQIERRIRMSQFANRKYKITQFGASTKASAAQNQKAINHAILLCSRKGGGCVVVPRGVWHTGAIRLNNIENVYNITIRNCRFDGVTKAPVSISGKTRNICFDHLFINGSRIPTRTDRPASTTPAKAPAEMQRKTDNKHF